MTNTDTPAPPPSWADEKTRYVVRAKLLSDALKANKAVLFDALAKAGLSRVVVGFDGAGDSGQIEGVNSYIGETAAVLPVVEVNLASLPWGASEVETRAAPIAEALEAVAYDLLEAGHSGWEDNEGAFGEFTFETANRAIRLDFNQRFETSELSSFEW